MPARKYLFNEQYVISKVDEFKNFYSPGGGIDFIDGEKYPVRTIKYKENGDVDYLLVGDLHKAQLLFYVIEDELNASSPLLSDYFYTHRDLKLKSLLDK